MRPWPNQIAGVNRRSASSSQVVFYRFFENIDLPNYNALAVNDINHIPPAKLESSPLGKSVGQHLSG